jgi:hypothetical protein
MMDSLGNRLVLNYRNAEDTRRDAREDEGRLVGRIAVVALWGFVGVGVLLLPSALLVWVLFIVTAPM